MSMYELILLQTSVIPFLCALVLLYPIKKYFLNLIYIIWMHLDPIHNMY